MALTETLNDLLNRRFAELNVSGSNRTLAGVLQTDPGTFSRLIRGAMSLTEERARKWAALLHEDDPQAVAKFAEQLLMAAQPAPRLQTVGEFCDRIVAEGGAVPAQEISELFQALSLTTNPLVCCDYTDAPRAAQGAKYQALGKELAAAVAGKVSFAMFQRFGGEIPDPPPLGDTKENGRNSQSASTAAYMREVRDSCRSAYLGFLSDARTKAEKGDDVGKRLKLYELGDKAGSCLGTAFQAKMFYVQFDTETEHISFRHQRIFQWVSTPRRDLLIYRGEADIKSEAIRDSFYPIPHLFDLGLGLPNLPEHAAARRLKEALPGYRHPRPFDRWITYG